LCPLEGVRYTKAMVKKYNNLLFYNGLVEIFINEDDDEELPELNCVLKAQIYDQISSKRIVKISWAFIKYIAGKLNMNKKIKIFLTGGGSQ